MIFLVISRSYFRLEKKSFYFFSDVRGVFSGKYKQLFSSSVEYQKLFEGIRIFLGLGPVIGSFKQAQKLFFIWDVGFWGKYKKFFIGL